MGTFQTETGRLYVQDKSRAKKGPIKTDGESLNSDQVRNKFIKHLSRVFFVRKNLCGEFFFALLS